VGTPSPAPANVAGTLPDLDSPWPAGKWLACGAALCAAHLVLRLLVATALPPLPKEAELWNESHSFSLGYAAHPPLAFWLMRLGNVLEGPAADAAGSPLLAHRLGAVVLGCAFPWLIGWLAGLLFRDRRIVAWSFLLTLALPLLSAVGVLLLPDTPLVVFTLLFLGFFYRAAEHGRTADWLLAGITLGLALLSKLMVLLPLAGCLLFLLNSRQRRARLASRGPFLGLALALLVLSPFLFWNARNHWVSFRFQFWERHQADFGFSFWKLGEVFFEQVPNSGLLLPALLAALAMPVRRLRADLREPFRFVRLQACVTLGFFVAAGSVTETHPHWTVLAYPPALLALACVAGTWSRRRARTLQGLVGLSLAGTALGCLLLPPALALLRLGPPPAGWPEFLARKLEKARTVLVDWEPLARQVNAHLARLPPGRQGMLFTLDAQAACVVACRKHQGPVVDLTLLLREHVRKRDVAGCRHLTGAGGLCVTGLERSVKDELEFLFEHVREAQPLESSPVRGSGKRFQVFEVSNLKSDVFARLPVAAGGVWAGLPKRSHLDQCGRQAQPGAPPALVLTGWIGFVDADRPPVLELRVDGRTVLRLEPNQERPDVSEAFYGARGRHGAPVTRCGFNLCVPLEMGDGRVQLFAFTSLGQRTLLDRKTRDLPWL
jgi:hypothetical protein